jgi:ankyrin repeat protein
LKNVDKQDTNGVTPLFWACKGADFEMTKYLTEQGANLTQCDTFGNSLFMLLLLKEVLN